MSSRTVSPPPLSDPSSVPSYTPSVVVARPPLLRPPTLWCVLPSCFFFAFAAAYQDAALPPLPEQSSSVVARSGQMLPLSQTLVVTSRKTSGSVLLRGTIQAAGQIVGEAPLGGQVSRVWVRSGQRVEVSDRILEISSGASTRPAPAAERGQNAAEAAQVAAVTRQQQLERRMRDAQAEFREAELRVDAANRKVNQARDLVARLQRGEAVPLSVGAADAGSTAGSSKSASSTTSSSSAREVGSSRHSRRDASPGVRTDAETKASSERKRAMQDALDAQRAAEQAQSKAKNAFYAASAAENLARLKKTRVESAQADARKTQEKFDAKLADAATLEAARTALAEAESDATEAAGKATSAREEAGRLQAQAEEAKTQSDKAGQRAAQALQKLQLLANAPGPYETQNDAGEPRATAAPTAAANGSDPARNESSGKLLSPEAAVALVRAAIRESDAAAKDAARLKNQAESYSRQVKSTKNRLESSSQQLAQAQQNVLDSTIQANLSSVRAPASGVVTSVASVAQEVSRGEAIVTISRSNRLEVVFRDTTGIWRYLRPGMVLPAAVLLKTPDRNAQNGNNTSDRARLRVNNAVTLAQYTQFRGTPAVAATIRLRDIKPPKNDSQSTLKGGAKRVRSVEMRAVIARDGTNQLSGARLRAGQSVVCSIAKPGTRETLMVPIEAVVAGEDGRPMIAVLTPLPAATTAPPEIDSMPVNEVSSAHSPQADGPAITASVIDSRYSIEWRPVVVGKGDGIQQEIRSGLASGERIALQAASLRAVAALQQNGSILQLTQS